MRHVHIRTSFAAISGLAPGFSTFLSTPLREAGTTKPPGELLRKLASYPRQHDRAVAFREIGRVERTLFMIEWLLDADMQRRAGLGLNKGEAHHALKSVLRIGRQGEIRDRTSGAQHFRIAGLNLLTAIIIYWNTENLGHAVRERELAGLDTPPDLLVHVSPLGWAHVLLTGEYRWRRTMASRAWRTFSPSTGIDPYLRARS